MGYFNYSLEPKRDILFIDIKSCYASIECVDKGLNPMVTSLCVMSHADNSSGLILAASPTFKKVFGKSNVGRSRNLPFDATTKKFNYKRWYATHTEATATKLVVVDPEPKQVAFIENWAEKTMIVPPRMRRYIDVNIQINQLFRNYTSVDEIHPYSIDEGFLDMTEALPYWFPHEENKQVALRKMAQQIQRDIYHQFGLYTTVGLSNSNPLLAKLALDNEAKHNYDMKALWNYEDVETKVWAIPSMTDFWGIGDGFTKQFARLGINSIKELANANPEVIKKGTKSIGLQNFFHANGIDESNVKQKYRVRVPGLSNSQVLPRIYTNRFEIELIIKEMIEQVSIRLRRAKKVAGTVSLYIGFSIEEMHQGIHVSNKIDPTNSYEKMTEKLMPLFRERYKDGGVMTVGIGTSNLIDEPFELLPFDFENTGEKSIQQMKHERMQNAIDKIRIKYNYNTIVRGTAFLSGSRQMDRANLVGGHSAGGLAGLD